MHREVFRLLDRKETEQAVRALRQRTFVNGKATAGGGAAQVKNNLQVERGAKDSNALDALVDQAMKRHRDFQTFALPKCWVLPLFSRYEPGMGYGDHVDGGLMGGPNGIRTDLAMTLFLSPPESYDGGELVIEGGDEIKLDAGEAIVYSATSVHHVAPVTRGTRLAAVTWIQSAVRDEHLRTILYDLARASTTVDQLNRPDLSLLLSKAYQNLIRFAAAP